MARGLIVDAQAVWSFAKELRRYAGELDGNTAKMLSRLSSLHSAWRDAKYDRFHSDMKAIAKDVKKARSIIEEYSKHLDDFARKADIAERARIGRG